MAISTPKLGSIGAILVISTLLTYFILASSIIPQYSVYEFYNTSERPDMIDTKVQLVGDVLQEQTDEFLLGDWETDGRFNITINHENVAKPAGFEVGKRVMIEGVLKQNGDHSFYVEANLISTKCPTKYEHQE